MQAQQQAQDAKAILVFPLRKHPRSTQDPVLKSIGDLVVVVQDLWTVIAAVALAVNPNAEYLRIKDLRLDRILVTTEAGMSTLMNSDGSASADDWVRPRSVRFHVLERFKGEILCGMKYQSPFRFYEQYFKSPQAFTVVADPSLAVGAGVGASLVLPAFDARHLALCRQHDIFGPDQPPPCPFDGTKIHKDYPSLDGSDLVGCALPVAEERVAHHTRAANQLLHHSSRRGSPATWPQWKVDASGVYHKTPAVELAAKPTMSKAAVGNFRLMRDIAECMRDPMDGIQLVVHEKDIRTMCAILTPVDKIYVGIRLHLTINIPHSYPADSPRISIDTPIPHPNIFGSYICCDILKGTLIQDPATGEITGYTPAYPLQTILAQLLSFFTAEVVDQESYGSEKRVAKRTKPHWEKLKGAVSQFACKHCGFGPPPEARTCLKCGALNRPSPPGAPTARAEETVGKCRRCGDTWTLEPQPKIVAWYPVAKMPQPKTLSTASSNLCAPSTVRNTFNIDSSPSVLDRLVPDIWQLVFLHLSSKDIASLGTAYPRLQHVVNVDSIVIRRNLRCFFLRSDFNESILGVGVQVASAGKSKLKYSSAFDILSSFAFRESKIRESPWGEPFTHFLPLVINRRHFRRAKPDIEAAVMALNGREDDTFDPALIIPTFARWMNQMVVDLMRDVLLNENVRNTDALYGKPLLHASEKALTGYCTLMHLLLVLVGCYPQVLPVTYAKVNGFLSDPALRHKRHVPDLGELLVWLALVPGLSWATVQRPLVEELLTRNAVWLLNQHPHLAFIEPRDTVSNSRLRDSFAASLTGLRLLLFQVRFLKDLVWEPMQAIDLDAAVTASAAAASAAGPRPASLLQPFGRKPPHAAEGAATAPVAVTDALARTVAATPHKSAQPAVSAAPHDPVTSFATGTVIPSTADAVTASIAAAEDDADEDGWVVVNKKARKPPAQQQQQQRHRADVAAAPSGFRSPPRVPPASALRPPPSTSQSSSPTAVSATAAAASDRVLPPYDESRAVAHLAALIAASDATFGLPSPRLAAGLAAYARRVLRVADFESFFELLDAPPPGSSSSSSVPSAPPRGQSTPPPGTASPAPPPPLSLAICRALRSAVNRSLAVGYHRCPYNPGELYALRKAAEPATADAGGGPPPGWPIPQFQPGPRSFFAPSAAARTANGKGKGRERQPRRRRPRPVIHAFREINPDCACSTCAFLRRYRADVAAASGGADDDDDDDASDFGSGSEDYDG